MNFQHLTVAQLYLVTYTGLAIFILLVLGLMWICKRSLKATNERCLSSEREELQRHEWLLTQYLLATRMVFYRWYCINCKKTTDHYNEWCYECRLIAEKEGRDRYFKAEADAKAEKIYAPWTGKPAT